MSVLTVILAAALLASPFLITMVPKQFTIYYFWL